MKTLKKTKIVTALIGAFSILSFTAIFAGGSIAHANPDYICYKMTYDAPCNITSYSAWDRATKSRIATGYKVTSVYYYSVRIGCESGDSGYVIGDAGWASGRRTWDYINSASTCSIVQYDYNSPSGNPLVQ